MLKSRERLSLFERLRHSTALRMLVLCAAFLVSQNSLACALEEAWSGDSVELASDVSGSPEAPRDGGGCALCTDCAHGGCCGFAAAPRTGSERFALPPWVHGRIGPTTTTPTSWTPPTLLRPPIVAA
jgi:hypothetical protein